MNARSLCTRPPSARRARSTVPGSSKMGKLYWVIPLPPAWTSGMELGFSWSGRLLGLKSKPILLRFPCPSSASSGDWQNLSITFSDPDAATFKPTKTRSAQPARPFDRSPQPAAPQSPTAPRRASRPEKTGRVDRSGAKTRFTAWSDRSGGERGPQRSRSLHCRFPGSR